MNKKSIKILLCFHNLNVEGAPRMLLNLAKVLVEEQYIVEAVSFKDGRLRSEIEGLGIKIRIIENVNYGFDDSIDSYLHEFNCIIANTILMYGLIYKYGNTLPIIWYLHEYKLIENLYSREFPILSKCLSIANNVVVVGNNIRDWLSKTYGITEPAVIHNVIDDNFKKPKVPVKNDKLEITFMGTIANLKGQDILLNVNHKLLDKNKVHINIVGANLSPDDDYFKESICSYKDDNVSFLGELVDEGKAEIFNKTDVLVLASFDEASPLVVLEALSYGIPVILTDAVGCRELINKKCGWFFNRDDQQGLAELIKDIYSGKYNLVKFKKEARKQFEYFNNYDNFKDLWIKLIKNNVNKVNVHLFQKCTDCGACRCVCPNAAIMQKENDEGFMYPFVDSEKCSFCGKCVQVCPIVNFKKIESNNPKCYAVQSKDSIRLNRSSSGGVFGVLADYFLKNKGYVCGAVFDDDWHVQHVVSNNKDVLYNMRGSKYLQSDTSNIFVDIKELLDRNKQVLFTGTSCQIAGLKSFLNNDYPNLFCVDLICEGVASPAAFRKYLSEEFKIEDIKDIHFRNKRNNEWKNFYFKIESDNKVIYEMIEDNAYSSLFLWNVITRPSCYECKVQSIPRQGDLTIGDFWGIDKYDPEIDDNKGTSVVLVNSKKGESLVNALSGNFKLWKEESINDAKDGNRNIYSSSKPHINRSLFFDMYNFRSIRDCHSITVNNKCDAILLNFWSSKNYGAILTVYALFEILKHLKYHVKVCNYVPKIFKNIFPGSFSESFANKHFNLTEQITSYDQFKSLNDYTETFIVGSDQVFNYDIYSTHGGNIYQFSFAKKNKRKIACSASFGRDWFSGPEGEKEIFKCLLEDFNSLSVREESGNLLLHNEFNINSDVICDPVFALTKEEWTDLAGIYPRDNGDYSACYILAGGHDDLSVDWIENVISATQAQLDFFPIRLTFKKNYDCETWLNYIAYSNVVVTDSFHAACFSIIFNKPLIYLLNNEELYPRLDAIFKKFHVNVNLISKNNYKDKIKKIEVPENDFSLTNQVISQERKRFIEWIDTAMKEDIKPDKFQWLREILYERDKFEDLYRENEEEKHLISNELQNYSKSLNESIELHDKIVNSSSWKLTKPYRKLGWHIKKVINKFKN